MQITKTVPRPSLDGIVPLPATEFEPPRSSVPAGFDAIFQMSTAAIHRAVAASLVRLGLNPLSARTPYIADTVPTSVRTLVEAALIVQSPHFDQGLPQLEVLVRDPRPTTFVWPAPPEVVSTAGTAMAHAVPPHSRRLITLVWTIDLNLFRAYGSPTAPPASTGAMQSLARLDPRDVTLAVATAGGAFDRPMAPDPLPSGSRVLLAQGTATMQVPCDLEVNGALFQVRLTANFDNVTATFDSSDPAMVAFDESTIGQALLGEALRALANHFAVAASPTVRLAGALSPTQIAASGLPALHVIDMLVDDFQGPALAFCASLGATTSGVPAMVRAFLAGSDFAFFSSEKLYSPLLKQLWCVNVTHLPFVSDIALELPTSDDGNEFGTGHARVRVVLGSTLSESGLIASIDPQRSDPLRIVSEQNVTLLALWDPQGNPVQDLGDLAEPATVPFALTLRVFESLPANAGHALGEQMNMLLSSLVVPLLVPTTDKNDLKNVTGFTSSPLKALVSRWSLPLLGPGSGGLTDVTSSHANSHSG